MPIPAKPSWWVIFPGRGLLKTSNPLVPDSNQASNTAGGQVGMTQVDKAKCEARGWYRILMALSTRYDISGWGSDPPYDLESFWDMLASAYYRIMEIGASGAERNEEAIVPIAWIKSVQRDLERVSNPSDEGLNLISGSTGQVIRPISGILAPCVAAFDLTLFPGMDNETSGGGGGFVGGSLQEFQKMHGWLSQSWDVEGLVL